MAGERGSHLNERQHRHVAEAIHAAERDTGLQFCVYLGPTEADARAHAERMFVEAGLHERPAVLLLVAPAERQVEIVTSEAARARISDAAAQRAIDAMVHQFRAGKFAPGIASALHDLAAVAGPGRPAGEDLPDMLED